MICMNRNEVDHSVIYKHYFLIGVFIFYVHDIVIVWDDCDGIKNLKQLFFQNFQVKDLKWLDYFPEIEAGSIKIRNCHILQEVCFKYFGEDQDEM